MKKYLFLALLLPATAWGSLYKYTFDGISTENLSMSGSFIYDDAANVEWTFDNGSQSLSNALSDFSLRIDQDQWSRQAGWDATRSADGVIATQDANLAGRGDTEFQWNPVNWCLSFTDTATEIAGKIVNVYKEAYFPASVQSDSVQLASARFDDPEHDAAPVPEPSSLVLLGLALLMFFGVRRARA